LRPISVKVGKEFSIIPAGCLHWPIGERDLLAAWVEELRSTPHAYGILMGDSLDVARTHYRDYARSYRGDDNSQEAFDAYVTEEVGKLADVLRPVASRILGLVQGNHYWEYCDGTNTEQDLCKRLKIKYLGVMGLIQLRCHRSATHTQNLTIFAHHSGGTAGGRTTGGDVNALTRQEHAWDADIYLLGHTHRRIAFKEPVMQLSHRSTPPKVIERTKVFVRTGAFLKGFKDTEVPVNRKYAAPYAETRAYRPTDLGWVKIHVLWREKADGLAYPEYSLTY